MIHGFYHPLEVRGEENIPKDGPLIVVANHGNSLMDPLILWASISRPLRMLAKAPLFKNIFLLPWLKWSGTLPVERRQDPGSDPEKNTSLFTACHEALAQGEAIALFPEGISHDKPELAPLKTGVARMALLGQAKATILPVGLLFSRKNVFRTPLLVRIGKPISTESYGESPTEVRRLTQEIEKGIKNLIVEGEGWESLRLLGRIRSWVLGTEPRAPGEDFATLGKAVAVWRKAREEDPIRTRRLMERARRLASLENRLHPSGRNQDPGWTLLWQILGLPLGIWGLWPNFLTHRLIPPLARRWGRDRDTDATFKVYLSLILYPLTWALWMWGLSFWARLPPWQWALVVASWAPAGVLALGYARQRRALMAQWGARLLWLRKPRLATLWEKRKEALVKEAKGWLERLERDTPWEEI